MKYLYALPLVLLLLTSCGDEKKQDKKEAPIDPTKTDLYFYKLKGKVKNFSEKSFSYTGGSKGSFASETNTLDTDMQFDERGMLTSDKRYNTAGISEENTYNGRENITVKKVFNNNQPFMVTDYNRDDKKNATIITRRDKTGKQIDRTLMKYMGKNMLEKTVYNEQDYPTDRTTYEYDKNGNVTTENFYLNSDVIKSRGVYEYDGKNHKTGEVRYNGDKLSFKTAITYEGDKITAKETTNDKGILEYSEKFTYDKQGNMLSYTRYEKQTNTTMNETYTYDANNNMISVFVKTQDRTIKTINTYDEKSNLTSTKTTDRTGAVLNNRTYTYQYDSNGNWTKKIVNINDQPAFVVERTINYY